MGLGAGNFLGLVGYGFAEYVGKFGFEWWFRLMVVVGSQNFGVICGFHFHVWGKTMTVLA